MSKYSIYNPERKAFQEIEMNEEEVKLYLESAEKVGGSLLEKSNLKEDKNVK
jgi:hypothetical protein